MNNLIIANLLGYTGAIVGTSVMVPQMVKSWQTKKVDDVSMGMLVLYILNCVLWLTYGLLVTSMPLIVANIASLIFSLAQLFLKRKYSH